MKKKKIQILRKSKSLYSCSFLFPTRHPRTKQNPPSSPLVSTTQSWQTIQAEKKRMKRKVEMREMKKNVEQGKRRKVKEEKEAMGQVNMDASISLTLKMARLIKKMTELMEGPKRLLKEHGVSTSEKEKAMITKVIEEKRRLSKELSVMECRLKEAIKALEAEKEGTRWLVEELSVRASRLENVDFVVAKDGRVFDTRRIRLLGEYLLNEGLMSLGKALTSEEKECSSLKRENDGLKREILRLEMDNKGMKERKKRIEERCKRLMGERMVKMSILELVRRNKYLQAKKRKMVRKLEKRRNEIKECKRRMRAIELEKEAVTVKQEDN